MSNENIPAGAVDPEQFKKIAAVTITNSSIIAALAALQATMISKMVPLLSDDPEVDGLLDSAQELRDTMAGLQSSLAAARKELGLT